MTKLIVCTGSLMSGGAERVLSILSTPFADAYDSVEYVLWLDARYSDVFYKIDPRVKITRISQASHSNGILHHLKWFRHHVKKEKPDAILAFMVMINFSVMVSQLFCRFPLFLAERNDPRYFGRNKWLRKLINVMYSLPNVRRVIMQTENNRNYFSEKVRKKTDVIYNPVLMDEEYIGCSIREKKEKRIVSVARLEKQKHQHILIKAFSSFLVFHPDYTLTFYGDGSIKGELEGLCRELGINSKVFFPGRTKDVYNSIKNASMFIMTSEYEGMSNSLIEAMCLGLPCISTKVSGATDLIKDGENFMLIDVDDVTALLEAMLAVADNSELANKISINATKTYHILKADIIAEQWVNCLKNN